MTSRPRRPPKRRPGLPPIQVSRDIKLAEHLPKITGTSLDNPKEQDALIILIDPQEHMGRPEVRQAGLDLIERAHAGENVSAVEVLQRLERHEDIDIGDVLGEAQGEDSSSDSDWFPTDEEEQAGPRVNNYTIWEAIYHAYDPRDTTIVAAFLRNPHTRAQIPDKAWLALAEYIVGFNKRLAGNPYNAPNMEVREAARSVDADKQQWRLQNNKVKVPPRETNNYIATAIARISQQRGVAIPPASGLYANLERRIRTALKSRQF